MNCLVAVDLPVALSEIGNSGPGTVTSLEAVPSTPSSSLVVSVVTTTKEVPYPMSAGASTMTGRAPRERYGGEKSSAFLSSGMLSPSPLPVCRMRPSGSSRIVEW